MTDKTPRRRAPYGPGAIPLPLQDADRALIIEAIERGAADACGNDVPGLVQIVEEAIRTWLPKPLSAQRQAFRDTARSLMHELESLVNLTEKLSPLLAPYGSPPSESLWSWTNPWAAAIIASFPEGAGRQHAALANAIHELIASTRMLQQPENEEPSDDDEDDTTAEQRDEPVAQLVRAVCIYIYEQDLPLDLDWDGEKGVPLEAGSRTAELIEMTARAFGFDVPNSRLRGHLRDYAKVLRSEHMSSDTRRKIRNAVGKLEKRRGSWRPPVRADLGWMAAGLLEPESANQK